MKSNQTIKNLLPPSLLMLVTVIWGGGFIFTNLAILAGISPALLLTLRFLLPAIILFAVFRREIISINRKDFIFCTVASVILFLAFFCQTYGIKFTTPANSAFLTATNVIMVPFISAFFSKKPPESRTIACALFCFSGAALLSWSPNVGITFNIGDIFSLLCAFLFACHIAYLGFSSEAKCSAAAQSFFQMLIPAMLSFITFLLFERDTFSTQALIDSALPMLYLALLSTGFCYFVQNWAQRLITPSKAAIILCAEGFWGSAFSVLCGFDSLTANFVIGGAIILISTVTVQLDFKKFRRTPAANC